jgi:hypothetical protein
VKRTIPMALAVVIAALFLSSFSLDPSDDVASVRAAEARPSPVVALASIPAIDLEEQYAIEQDRLAVEAYYAAVEAEKAAVQAYLDAVWAELVAQEEARRRATYRAPAPRSSGQIVEGGDVWSRLAQCECGGNPSCNTGNGYYGTFQFTLSTWRSVGGEGLPSDASYEEQLRLAQALQARSGWGQWPACTAKMGLR